MKKVFGFLLIFSCTVYCPGTEILLVKDSKPVSEIVTGERPTRSAQFAALELQHFIKCITGGILPIRSKATEEASTLKIYVGETGKKISFTGEEYSVDISPEGIFLSGNDTPEYGKVDYSDPKTFPPLEYYYRSSLFAVYDFLEKSCGVRFYSFGDSGVAFPSCKTLKVESSQFKNTPKMDAFRRVYFEKPVDATMRDYLLLHHRWRESTVFGACNHNIYSIYYRYWGKAKSPHLAEVFIEKHPEYFAQRKTMRNNSAVAKWQYPGEYVPSQLCYSSDGPVQYFAEEACKVFRGESVPGARFENIRKMPGKPFYYPVQPDDDPYACECEKCSSGLKENSSAYHYAWINKIAKEAKKRNPEVNIVTLSYGIAIARPKDLRLEPGVSIQMCMSPQTWFHPLVYKRQHDIYKDWVRHEIDKRPLTVWLYFLDPVSEAKLIHKYEKCFPVLYPEHTGKYFTEFIQDGIRGFFAEISISHHELEGYLISRLAYDPSIDCNTIIDEYFKLYYGSAGTAMKTVYAELESIGFNPENYRKEHMQKDPRISGSYVYGIHTERENWYLGTPERMKRIRGLLNTALATAASPLEKARVQRFIDKIWNPAEEGRISFEKRESLRNIPVPKVTLTHSPTEFDGDLDKADFSAAYNIREWKTVNNQNVKTNAILKVLTDSTHLYLDFTEKSSEAYDARETDFWKNGLEIFLADSRDGSYWQIFIDPNGKIETYKNEIINGVVRFGKADIPVRFKNTLTQKSWNIKLSLPLKDLGNLSPGKTMFSNFMRVKKNTNGNVESFYFSPIFSKSHAEGLYRMGELILSGKLMSPRTWDVNGTFQKGEDDKMPAGWFINTVYPAIASFADGKFRVSATKEKFSHVFRKEFFPVIPGDTVTFDFTASGTGQAACALYFFNGQDGLHFIATSWQSNFQLTLDPREHKITMKIPAGDKYKYPVSNVRVAFMVWPNSSIDVSDLTVSVNKPQSYQK